MLVAFVLLILNAFQGNLLGFKAFLYPSRSLINQKISFTHQGIEPKNGDIAVLNRYQSYFMGEIIEQDHQVFLIQNNISVEIDDEIVYVEMFNVHLSVVALGVLMLLIVKGGTIYAKKTKY